MNSGNPPARVAVGERYLGSDGAVHVAAQPLMASLTYAVNHAPTLGIPGPTGPCVALCRAYPVGDPLPQDSWRFTAHIFVMWRYTRLDGSVALDSAPAAPEGEDQMLIVVDVRWANGWTMANAPSPNVCEVANDMFNVPPSTSLPGVNEWSQFPAKPASAGCLLAGAQTVDAYNNPVGPTVFVLYRFGVLLAANNLAAEYFPSLPRASAEDRALARLLAPPGAQG